MKDSRSYKAGVSLGNIIVEMVHLMYQNDTARRFMHGLMSVLKKEHQRRKKEKEKRRE